MAMRNAQIQAMGGQMITLLLDGATPGKAPTQANLVSWINLKKANFTGVLENVGTKDSFVANYGFDNAVDGRDNFFTFDLATMKLVDWRAGDPTGALDNLTMLLSK